MAVAIIPSIYIPIYIAEAPAGHRAKCCELQNKENSLSEQKERKKEKRIPNMDLVLGGRGQIVWRDNSIS